MELYGKEKGLAFVIHVSPAPEPADFDVKVRRKGLKHLAGKRIPLYSPLPSGVGIPPYWRDCLDDLHKSYNGICAYLCIYIERVTGAASTDHFIPKSADPGLAYEWNNYRLASMTINAKKGICQTVLDPFKVRNDWFRLELLTGRIYPNPVLRIELKTLVANTIELLGLDKPGIRNIRNCHFQDYINNNISQTYLQKYSPFVYAEAENQGLL